LTTSAPIIMADWTVAALLLTIASAIAADRFGWRNVITASVLATLMILGIIGAWIDLRLPE